MTGAGRNTPPARVRPVPAGLRLLLLLGVIAALLVSTSVLVDEVNAPPRESVAAVPLAQPAPLHSLAAEPGAPGPGGDPARRTLVLYNETGASAAISHSDAIQAANLASRGGSWTMRPVERYTAGDLRGYQSAIYVARYSETRLPAAFLRDVALDHVPVLWMGDNIEQLFTAQPATTARYGWRPAGPDGTDVPTVEYAGQQLLRRTGAQEQLNRVELAPNSRAETLGTARHADGSGYPWAVRSRNLTYVGEVPFSYVDTRDRYLAAADIIGRLVAPDAPDRKRALIRIEDVGPNTDPAQIRAIADLLSARGVPFSLATYPYYRDPKGAAHDGVPTSFRLVDVPDVVEALKYAQDRGATIIMHGYSHQHADSANPYDGVSANDFEFYTAHVDEQNVVRLDAPVPEDSRQWASQRLAVGRAEFTRVGLADPGIFEFPHYAGSAVDYQAVHDMFAVRYDQGTYFSGQCPQGRCSTTEDPGSAGLSSQYFPYPVRDVYGSVVIPENLGNISDAYNNNAARTAQDVVDAAGAMTVVRDGVASTFFHPYLPLSELQAVVDGIEAKGFRFVSPSDIVHDTGQPSR